MVLLLGIETSHAMRCPSVVHGIEYQIQNRPAVKSSVQCIRCWATLAFNGRAGTCKLEIGSEVVSITISYDPEN